MRYIIISTLLHSLIFITGKTPESVPNTETIEIIPFLVEHQLDDFNITRSDTVEPGAAKKDEIQKALEDEYNDKILSLTSKRFLYTNFFDRVNKLIKPPWHSCINKELKLKKKLKMPYPARTKYVTFLRVIIIPSGDIKQIIVVKSSGYRYLDECAINTVRNVQKFGNIPKGLIDDDGNIRFNWIFTIQN